MLIEYRGFDIFIDEEKTTYFIGTPKVLSYLDTDGNSDSVENALIAAKARVDEWMGDPKVIRRLEEIRWFD